MPPFKKDLYLTPLLMEINWKDWMCRERINSLRSITDNRGFPSTASPLLSFKRFYLSDLHIMRLYEIYFYVKVFKIQQKLKICQICQKFVPFGTKNGLTWQACQCPDVVQKGPKWSQMVNKTCFWPFGTFLGSFGPFWTISDKTWFFAPNYFGQEALCVFEAKNWFLS